MVETGAVVIGEEDVLRIIAALGYVAGKQMDAIRQDWMPKQVTQIKEGRWLAAPRGHLVG